MTPRHPRYDSLDIWRGIACLLVVAYHASVYVYTDALDARVRAIGGTLGEWGLVAVGRFWFGVPIFFVISGYCIAASADATRAKAGGVGRYFVRRFRRIYPPLWATTALGVLFALPLLVMPSHPVGNYPLVDPTALTASQWLGNLTLTEEWRPAVGGAPKNYLLGQVWTLCFEEQFYLVVGLVLLVAPRWFFPGVWVVTGLVLLNLADLNGFAGSRLGLDLNRYQVRVPGLFTEGLWLSFAAGVVVYYRRNHAEPTTGVMLEVLLAVTTFAAIRYDLDPLDQHKTLAKWTAVACGFAVLACRLWSLDATLSTARWTAPLRFCGRICYSLYLVHPLVAVPLAWAFYRAGWTSLGVTLLVLLPLAMILSVGVGYLFHRVIERRFLNAPRATVDPSAPPLHTLSGSDSPQGTRHDTPPAPVALAGPRPRRGLLGLRRARSGTSRAGDGEPGPEVGHGSGSGRGVPEGPG